MSQEHLTDENLWDELRTTVKDESSLVTITLNKDDKGFGFNIRGGVDHPHVGCDPGIFVTAIRVDSVAGNDGRLSTGDRILAVNNIALINVTHDEAVTAFRTTDPTISLLVEKRAEERLLEASTANNKRREQPEDDDSSIQGTFTSFFKTNLGGLALGLLVGSLAVFVGTKAYKAFTR